MDLCRKASGIKQCVVVYLRCNSELGVGGKYNGADDILYAVLQGDYKQLRVVHFKLVGSSIEDLMKDLTNSDQFVLRNDLRGLSIIVGAKDAPGKD